MNTPQTPGAPPPPPPGQPLVSWQAPPVQAGPAPGVEFAPHGARFFSYLIDAFILTIVLGVLIVVFVFASGPTAPATPRGTGSFDNPGIFAIGVLLALVIAFAYFPFFWARGGQTPGMKPFGLYVVRDRDGGPVSAGMAILRLIGYWINSIVFYIGFAWVLVDDRRRGWHDIIAGTVVVKR